MAYIGKRCDCCRLWYDVVPWLVTFEVRTGFCLVCRSLQERADDEREVWELAAVVGD